MKLFNGIKKRPGYLSRLLPVAVFACCGICCNKSGGSPATTQQKITYEKADDDFANPERGFYRYTQTNVDGFDPLDLAQLKSWRTLQPADGGNYSVISTLVFRYYVLEGYNDKPLPAAFIDRLANDFSIARQAGVKLIVRFTYTVTPVSGGCPEGFACPPYGDASKSIVLQHIAQLKSTLASNADVLAVLQMGFIGIWGENYYSDHFGDPSSNAAGKLLDNDWVDRSTVLKALLDALPVDRMVQVRIPQMKQRFVYGVAGTTTVPALSESEAFNGSDKARIGFHNDCFLASADDYGTFADYGSSSSPRQGANDALRAYATADGRYVPVGGETCDDTFSPQNDCETAGHAQTEMRSMHYSFLNCAYNNDVNNDWQSGGCMNSIRNELGYRFVLKDAEFPSAAAAGSVMKFSLNLANEGYASPFNPRPVKLILRKEGGSAVVAVDLQLDVRRWFSGNVTLAPSVTIPAGTAKGKYELLLFFPDAYPSIGGRPEYAIRLANKDCWEAATGYNKLKATITIQ